MAATLISWMLHLDVHLATLSAQYGAGIYLILFMVIFIETGLVVMPFLPGDSLLFIAGALAATGMLDLSLLIAGLVMAAISGDAVNYAVGDFVRRRAIDTHRIPLLKASHLQQTRKFFDRHGGKTIILARFVPIVRTLAPFVAALGRMSYKHFFAFNVVGALIWVISVTTAGFLFGTIPWIKNNLTVVILAIVFLSLLPAVFAWLNERRRIRRIDPQSSKAE